MKTTFEKQEDIMQEFLSSVFKEKQEKIIEIIDQLRLKNNHQGCTDADFESAKKEINNLFKNAKPLLTNARNNE